MNQAFVQLICRVISNKIFSLKKILAFDTFLVRCDESPENYCHSPGVVSGVVVVVVVRRQKL